MKLPLQISFHGMEPSEALEAAAAKKAHKLAEFFADIMSCRVAIEQQQQKHQHQGWPFAVRINPSLPRHELCVNRVQDEDAYARCATPSTTWKRQLEDAARAQARRSVLVLTMVAYNLTRMRTLGQIRRQAQ